MTLSHHSLEDIPLQICKMSTLPIFAETVVLYFGQDEKCSVISSLSHSDK